MPATTRVYRPSARNRLLAGLVAAAWLCMLLFRWDGGDGDVLLVGLYAILVTRWGAWALFDRIEVHEESVVVRHFLRRVTVARSHIIEIRSPRGFSAYIHHDEPGIRRSIGWNGISLPMTRGDRVQLGDLAQELGVPLALSGKPEPVRSVGP